VREGRWSKSSFFCYWDKPILELAGLTLGLVGFGSIAEAVARMAVAFDMNILVHSRSRRAPPPGVAVEFRDLDTLLARADVVSLHCPLTPETQGLVNAERLARMKPSALLLNTARGGLIDETALAAALNGGRLAGAGLDVLSVEPPPPDNPLLTARNCVITPHNNWATRATRQRLLNEVAANLKAFQEGRPVNVAV
jgi:glycerate dehydrogenase